MQNHSLPFTCTTWNPTPSGEKTQFDFLSLPRIQAKRITRAMRILFDAALVLEQNRRKCVKKEIRSLSPRWSENARSLSRSDLASWVFAVSKQRSLRSDTWIYTFFFLYESQSRLSLYLRDSRHNTALLLTLGLTLHNFSPEFWSHMWVLTDYDIILISAMAANHRAVSVRCVISSRTGAALRQHSSSHTHRQSMTLRFLTCLRVLEPHLVILIFRLGWGPHGLQAPRGPVLTVCRRWDLSLLGKSQLSKNSSLYVQLKGPMYNI